MKKLNGLDKYIIFSFLCLIIYTIMAYIMSAKYGVELDILTGLFFGVFGGEILLCALIKKLKLGKTYKEMKQVGKDEEAVG